MTIGDPEVPDLDSGLLLADAIKADIDLLTKAIGMKPLYRDFSFIPGKNVRAG
jgi:hypothetical protein